MPNLAGFPCWEVQFDKQGHVVDLEEVSRVVAGVDSENLDDLLVLAHGWNNDMAEARDLYRMFLENLRAVLDSGAVAGLPGRRFGVLTVLWPSKKFADRELTAGGAASVAANIETVRLRQQIDSLKGAFDRADADVILEQAGRLLEQLPNSKPARKQFAELLRTLMPDSPAQEHEVPAQFETLPGDAIMDRLSRPARLLASPGQPRTGGAASINGAARTAGGGANIGNLGRGFFAGARNLLNFVTYYQMKERAGTVGRGGLYQVLRSIRRQRPNLKLHLIGHSFGARLVTAATDGPSGEPPPAVATLSLLQAAFSHNGFAVDFDGTNDGVFRAVLAEHKVSGPILITHTHNDRAVGLAYPIASRIAGQVASGLGGPDDPFGGIGRNGARHTPEAVDTMLQGVGGLYTFAGTKVNNLSADQFISDHSDIAGKEVAYAILCAVATT